jgi:hypothetical protein
VGAHDARRRERRRRLPNRRRGWLGVLARRGLYSEPALRLLGHMLLVVARRA